MKKLLTFLGTIFHCCCTFEFASNLQENLSCRISFPMAYVKPVVPF